MLCSSGENYDRLSNEVIGHKSFHKFESSFYLVGIQLYGKTEIGESTSLSVCILAIMFVLYKL